MKIGINALYLLPSRVGGSETYIRNLVKWLMAIDRENEYAVFINRESAGIFESAAPGIRVIPCPVRAENRPRRILWEQFVLPFEVKRYGINVLLSAGMTAPFICPSTSVLVVFDLQHINQPSNFPRLYLQFLRSIIYISAKSANGLVTISNQAKNDIVHYYHIPPERIAVTHLAVDHGSFTTEGDTESVRRTYGLPDRFILYAASSLPHKNHERLLQAFQAVRERVPDLKLVLIGARDKGEPELRRKIQSLGLENDVLLLGWLPFEHVPAVYRSCDIFVFPSLHEGFGLPVIEAMACGAPVVCSRIEPLLEVAGDAALFVDPYNPSDISSGILSAVQDETTRQSLIEKGLERARQFTWEETAGKTLAFLKAIHRGATR